MFLARVVDGLPPPGRCNAGAVRARDESILTLKIKIVR